MKYLWNKLIKLIKLALWILLGIFAIGILGSMLPSNKNTSTKTVTTPTKATTEPLTQKQEDIVPRLTAEQTIVHRQHMKQLMAEHEKEKAIVRPTVKSFIENFNKSLKTLGSSNKMHVVQEKNNPYEITTIGSIDGNFQILFGSDKKTLEIESIILISTYSKKLSDMVETIFGLVSTVMALENTDMKKSDRALVSKSFRKMISKEKEIFKRKGSGEEITYMFDDFKSRDGHIVIKVLFP